MPVVTIPKASETGEAFRVLSSHPAKPSKGKSSFPELPRTSDSRDRSEIDREAFLDTGVVLGREEDLKIDSAGLERTSDSILDSVFKI